MGLFWDLMQQSQISQQQSDGESLEQRVAELEQQLHETRQIQQRLLQTLEQHFGKDLDGDGRTG